MAAVRPEFRADVLVADTTNPVFGAGPCAVAGCDRAITGHGLCSGHRQRWVKAGRPDLAVFIATTDPRWRRQQPNAACRVEACGYGSARQGCAGCTPNDGNASGDRTWPPGSPSRHRSSSRRPARPARSVHCQLWPQAASPFCHSHHNTWRTNGRPDIEEFATRLRRRCRCWRCNRSSSTALARS